MNEDDDDSELANTHPLLNELKWVEACESGSCAQLNPKTLNPKPVRLEKPEALNTTLVVARFGCSACRPFDEVVLAVCVSAGRVAEKPKASPVNLAL